MELTTMLMAVKAVGSVFKSDKQVKAVKKSKETQKKLVEETYQYNMKQVNEAYTSGFSDLMSKYALERYYLSTEAGDVASELNLQLAGQGVNLADSSINNDLENQLETEFTTNLQNLISSQYNESSMLVANMTAQKLGLDQSRTSQLMGINNAVANAMTQIDSNVKGNLANFGFQLMDDYTDFKARNPKENSLNFLTKFSF